MKCLKEDVLKIGDIILTTSTEKDSKGIRFVTKSNISHAMVYVETYSVVDATGNGVHARNTQRLFWPDECAVYVLRLKGGLTDGQLQRIVLYVRGRIGTSYSKIEAARSVVGRRDKKSRKQFCSRLVAQAYADAGLPLVESSDYCTPEELRQSDRLRGVPMAIRAATPHEIEAINNVEDTTQAMLDMTNKLLVEARRKNKKIEDLNDIDQHLIEHPEDDAYFLKLYQQSGYLTLWKKEYEINHWQYDLQIMLSTPAPKGAIQHYCEMVVQDGEMGLQRYEVNLAGYKLRFEEFGLQTFHCLQELYEKLVEIHRQRRMVAKQWLRQNKPDAIPLQNKNVGLVPHSAAWFAVLERTNKMQAVCTRSIIDLAGSVDVCSICGDAPAKDYRLVGHAISDEAICTLRLCADCWDMRRAMYTESFGLS
jgi:hypothetical protein